MARYGTQLCPAEVAAKFDRIDGSGIQTQGLPHFNRPAYSAPVSEEFTTGGQVALTFDQAASVCVTKCAKDPGCDAVSIVERTVDSVEPKTGKPEFRCLMVNTDLGPGAYVIAYPEENPVPCSCSVQSSVFLKLPVKVPNFEEVQCNINRSTEAFFAGINCSLGAVTDPAICGPVLTDDFNKFWRPGILCLAQNGGAAAVDACFRCVKSQNFENGTFDVCPADATDMTTILRSKCADACPLDKCETLLESGTLCALGAPMVFEGGVNHGGEIAGPDFVCPPVS